MISARLLICSRLMPDSLHVLSRAGSSIERTFCIGSTLAIRLCILLPQVTVWRLCDCCSPRERIQMLLKIIEKAVLCIMPQMAASAVQSGITKTKWTRFKHLSIEAPGLICRIRMAQLPCIARSERGAQALFGIFLKRAAIQKSKTNPAQLHSILRCRIRDAADPGTTQP